MKQLIGIIAIALAMPAYAAGVPPRLTNPGAWLLKREAPPGLLKTGERVMTALTITITPDGWPSACTIAASSGVPPLDAYACQLYMQNARFEPADRADTATSSRTRNLFDTWEANRNASDAGSSKAKAAIAASSVGMWVTTDDLPKGLLRPDQVVVINAALAIAPNGRIERCSITLPSERPELDRLTCGLLLFRGRYQPARDSAGHPTRGPDWRTVRWQVPID